MELEERIEAFIRGCDEPPTVRTIASKLKLRQREVLEAVEMDDRFCVNVALQNESGYTELKPADYTVECLVP